MRPLDLGIILGYFALILAIGLFASRRQGTPGDYFLGARNLPAWAVMLSIVGTETSALTVISVPGIGARGDLTFLQLPLGYLLGRIGVALWLLPGYFRGEQETAYQRLETRFGAPTRRAVSVVFLVTRFMADGVRLFAAAVPLAVVTGWSVPAGILVMGIITLAYSFFGGLKAVVWTEALQLTVYIAGGLAALMIALKLAGGVAPALDLAFNAGKLTAINPALSLTQPYTLWGGLIGGALLSAASHGTDHLIVQRLLATRSLRAARIALVGSGIVVILQFALFLLVGTAIWAAGQAPDSVPGDALFSRFIVQSLPAGLAGLVIAGILAAAMSSPISAMASAMTYDVYATWTGRHDAAHLLRVGHVISLGWGLLLIVAAFGFHAMAATASTPAVVLALSIASVTYGALLGTYILAGRFAQVSGPDAIRAVVTTVVVMLLVLFAARLATLPGLGGLAPIGRLAWPWYVPLGTALAIATGLLSAQVRRRAATAEGVA
jgi:Na+/proline symporter